MANKQDVLQMPSLALAKTGPTPGSKAWVKMVAKAHSETCSPLKLERRRLRLSAQAIVIDRCARQINDAKRTLPAQTEKLIENFSAMREAQAGQLPAERQGAFEAETVYRIAEMRMGLIQQVQSFDLIIAQLTGTLCQINALCLIVDSLTIRWPGKGKNKQGLYRHTAARYLHDIGVWTGETADMVESLCDMLRTKFDVPAPKTEPEETEETEVEDEDLVDQDERERLEKEAAAMESETA